MTLKTSQLLREKHKRRATPRPVLIPRDRLDVRRIRTRPNTAQMIGLSILGKRTDQLDVNQPVQNSKLSLVLDLPVTIAVTRQRPDPTRRVVPTILDQQTSQDRLDGIRDSARHLCFYPTNTLPGQRSDEPGRSPPGHPRFLGLRLARRHNGDGQIQVSAESTESLRQQRRTRIRMHDIPQMMSSEMGPVDRTLATSAGETCVLWGICTPDTGSLSVALIDEATYLGHFTA